MIFIFICIRLKAAVPPVAPFLNSLTRWFEMFYSKNINYLNDLMNNMFLHYDSTHFLTLETMFFLAPSKEICLCSLSKKFFPIIIFKQLVKIWLIIMDNYPESQPLNNDIAKLSYMNTWTFNLFTNLLKLNSLQTVSLLMQKLL